MTLDELNQKIAALPDYNPAAPNRLTQTEALYLRDERLGLMCGTREPTEEEVQVVHDQLFPK